MQREVLELRSERIPLEKVIPLDTPYTIYLDPCGACNFTCNFCPCNVSDYMKNKRHKIMSLQLFHKIVDDMTQFDEKIKVVNLYAFGEPLLNKDLPQMITYLKECNVCNEIRLSTNGSLLNPDLSQRLIDSGLDIIRISVEALNAEDYNSLCNIDLDFNCFLENIKDLYSRSRWGGIKIQVKIVNASLKNASDAERFFDLFTPIADYVNIEDIRYDWSEFNEMKYPDNSIRVNDEPFRGGTICTRPLIHMAIHSNGEVGACCADWKFKTVYGDVRKQSLKEIWKSQQLRDFQKMHLQGKRNEIEFCKTCTMKSPDNIDDVADIILQNMKK